MIELKGFTISCLAISVVIVHLFIKFEFHYLPESIALVFLGMFIAISHIVMSLGFLVGGILFVINYFFGYDYQVC